MININSALACMPREIWQRIYCDLPAASLKNISTVCRELESHFTPKFWNSLLPVGFCDPSYTRKFVLNFMIVDEEELIIRIDEYIRKLSIGNMCNFSCGFIHAVTSENAESMENPSAAYSIAKFPEMEIRLGSRITNRYFCRKEFYPSCCESLPLYGPLPGKIQYFKNHPFFNTPLAKKLEVLFDAFPILDAPSACLRACKYLTVLAKPADGSLSDYVTKNRSHCHFNDSEFEHILLGAKMIGNTIQSDDVLFGMSDAEFEHELYFFKEKLHDEIELSVEEMLIFYEKLLPEIREYRPIINKMYNYERIMPDYFPLIRGYIQGNSVADNIDKKLISKLVCLEKEGLIIENR